jgi:hypothetical protein
MSDTYENDFDDPPDPAFGTMPFHDNTNTPDNFGSSPWATFAATHYFPGRGVARYVGGSGLTGDLPPNDPRAKDSQ